MQKNSVLIVLLTVTIAIMAVAAIFLSDKEPSHVKSIEVPSVSLGCDRVVWKDAELELQASISNIKPSYFQWRIDSNVVADNVTNLKKKFEPGEHKVMLNVSFGSQMLQANQSITAIDSGDGIALRDFPSNNQRGFQTMYRGKDVGVKGVRISIDSLPPQEVNPCGQLTTKGLFAGEHAWRAEYQGKNIANGTFTLKEVSEIKISKISVAPSYRAGETVNAKMILKNTGTSMIKGFEIKTTIINHKYEWMGDKARKEFTSHYDSELKPGMVYEIPIEFTIPEKVSGITPSGSYSITVSLVLNGKVVDTKTVNTEIE